VLAQHCGDLAPAVDPAQLDLPTQYEAEEQDQRRANVTVADLLS